MSWIIFSIISIIIMSVLRIRSIRQLFDHTDKKRFIITSITSIISVIIISILYYYKQKLNFTEHIYGYVSIIIIVSLIFFRKQRFFWWILQSILRISLALMWWTSSSYSIAALGEESFKWLYIKKYITWLLWWIVLLWIISGIAFWRTENFIYIIQYIIQNKQHETVMSLVQQRWFIPIIVHIGSICMSILLWFSLQKKTYPIIARWISILAWVWSHYLFNISQIYHFSLWTGLIILGYLIIISYGLFRSDMIYNTQK